MKILFVRLRKFEKLSAPDAEEHRVKMVSLHNPWVLSSNLGSIRNIEQSIVINHKPPYSITMYIYQHCSDLIGINLGNLWRPQPRSPQKLV